MAEKRLLDKQPPDEKTQFEAQVYKLGLTLIDDFRTGKCRDRDKTLAAIIEIFRVQPIGGMSNAG